LYDPQGRVAIDSSGMLKAADGDPVISVGDCFAVRVGCEALNDVPMGRYDVTVTIITLIPGREIVRTILGRIRPPIGHIYGYRLQPGGAVGARVTSYRDWSEIDCRRRLCCPVGSSGTTAASDARPASVHFPA
jgi:hypothetical protein